MATGKPPLGDVDPNRVLALIPKSHPKLTGDFSSSFKEFVDACLQEDPEKRPTAQELLKMRFIKECSSTTIYSSIRGS